MRGIEGSWTEYNFVANVQVLTLVNFIEEHACDLKIEILENKGDIPCV